MAAEDGADGLGSLMGLGSTLQSLPDEKFLAVIDKLSIVSEQPPVVVLFDEYRPRLRLLKPHRPRSLKRPLCRPFEDLFPFGAAETGPGGVIDRRVIAPLWHHLESHENAALRALQLEFKATPPTDPQKSLDIGERLWRLAARVLMKAAIPDIDPEVSGLLRDILLVAAPVEGFKRQFPRHPIAFFGDGEKAFVKQQLDAFSGQAGAIRGYLLAIAARLAVPAELLRWLRESGMPVPAVLERFALGKLTDQIKEFDVEVATLDPERLAGEAQHLLAVLDAADEAVSGKARDTVKAQADAVKGKMRAALKAQILDHAPAEITAALTDSASREALVAAESYARALAKTRKAAAKVGLGSATDQAISSVRRNCIGRIDDLLKPASRAADPAADHAKTRAAVFQSVRLIELVDGASAGREILADAQRRMKALAR